MNTRVIFIYLCFAFLISAEALHAEQNLCRECMEESKDTINVRKMGVAYSKDKSEAESMAKIAARDSLLEVLRDSVAVICAEVEIKKDAHGEYLAIKYFDKNEQPTKYYFQEDNILTAPTIVCQQYVCEEGKKYKACCVLSAPIEEFSQASNIVMFQILSIMSSFF